MWGNLIPGSKMSSLFSKKLKLKIKKAADAETPAAGRGAKRAERFILLSQTRVLSDRQSAE